MYFINNGIRHDVFEAIDKEKDEFVYVVVCTECGDYVIFPEFEFIELVENGDIDIICENPDEEDEDEDDFPCDGDCDNCDLNENDYLDGDEIDRLDLMDDILEELHELKQLMRKHRNDSDLKKYETIVKVYKELFSLI